MRSLSIPCAILLAIITLIIFNSCWVTSKIERLLTLCEAIESKSAGDDADALLEQLLSDWDDCRDKLSLSISHEEIDRAESALFMLASYYFSGRDADFRAQLQSFKSALRHIADAQEFSAGNIF